MDSDYEKIHICLAICDPIGTYVKYQAAAICSILENTSSRVDIHLLHDDTLSMDNRNKLRYMVESYHQEIHFYQLNIQEFQEFGEARVDISIGILYRLKLCDVLSENMRKVIYVDSDIIANLNIEELWIHDLNDNMVAACRDVPQNSLPIQKGIVKQDDYFNSGVMIYDLSKIRKHMDMYVKSMEFLKKYPKTRFPDQDALNVIFRGQVSYLPQRFNLFTFYARNGEKNLDRKCIFHFAGDKVRLSKMELFDLLFFYYLARTPWGKPEFMSSELVNLVNFRNCDDNLYKNVIRLVTIKHVKVIVWSPKSVMMDDLEEILPLDPSRDYGVDSKQSLHGTKLHSLTVKAPIEVKKEKIGSFIVIVLSKRYYRDIREELIKLGMTENVDFYDGRDLLGDKIVAY